MSLHSRFGQLYRVADRWLLSRLPMWAQRRIAQFSLGLARAVFPTRQWATSADPLLARRFPRALPTSASELPDWARIDMDDLARRIDPLLSPRTYEAPGIGVYAAPIHWQEAGACYRRLRAMLRRTDFDTVFVVPWLKRGGADLGVLHYVRACHETFGHRTLVVGTDGADSPWSDRLPADVQFLDAGSEFAKLSAPHAEQEQVLARLLIQLQPHRVHFVNSHLGWRTLARHGHALGSITTLYASLFCDDRSPDGYRDGPAIRYLSQAARHLRAVVTDNTASPREWIDNLGIAPELFHVVHFPAPRTSQRDESRPERRLLWASRLDRQKRPDLLARLVSAMPEFHWDIHGSQVVPGHSGDVTSLKQAANATLHGGYEDFGQIVRPEHLAFVYTSAWDGMPNVLLEAASAGLPIVAPDIGGIGDLIPADLLVRPDDDVDRFVQLIRALEDAASRKYWLERQSIRLRDFSWDAFIADLRLLPGYAS